MKLTVPQEETLRSLGTGAAKTFAKRYQPIVRLVEVGFAREAHPGKWTHSSYEATDAGRAWLAEKDKATP